MEWAVRGQVSGFSGLVVCYCGVSCFGANAYKGSIYLRKKSANRIDDLLSSRTQTERIMASDSHMDPPRGCSADSEASKMEQIRLLCSEVLSMPIEQIDAESSFISLGGQ